MGYQENTPLFEVVEELADPRYPEAYADSETGEVMPEETKRCTKCKQDKPTTAFMRRASVRRALTYTNSSIEEASPHHFIMDVVHNNCNECHEKQLKLAARKYVLDPNGKPVRIRRQSADDYDAELKATGRHEYMVPNPYRTYNTNKERYIGTEFVPYRYILVEQYKEKQRQRRAEGTQAAKKRGYAPAYMAHVYALKNESNRMRAKVRGVDKFVYDPAKKKDVKVRVILISEQAVAFCQAYLKHLDSIRDWLRKDRYAPTAIAPKPTPLDYIREDALTTQQARELWRGLSSKDQESVKPRYL